MLPINMGTVNAGVWIASQVIGSKSVVSKFRPGARSRPCNDGCRRTGSDPARMSLLLRHCGSIKVKRLFLAPAERPRIWI